MRAIMPSGLARQGEQKRFLARTSPGNRGSRDQQDRAVYRMIDTLHCRQQCTELAEQASLAGGGPLPKCEGLFEVFRPAILSGKFRET